MTVINLHPHEYTQELHYYPLAVKLHRFIGTCTTLNDSKRFMTIFSPNVSAIVT